MSKHRFTLTDAHSISHVVSQQHNRKGNMPNNAPGKKIIQTQVDNSVSDALDNISNRTYVPRAVLLSMAIQRFIDDVNSGRVTMGINLAGSVGTPAASGPQASFTVVPEPPKS